MLRLRLKRRKRIILLLIGALVLGIAFYALNPLSSNEEVLDVFERVGLQADSPVHVSYELGELSKYGAFGKVRQITKFRMGTGDKEFGAWLFRFEESEDAQRWIDSGGVFEQIWEFYKGEPNGMYWAHEFVLLHEAPIPPDYMGRYIHVLCCRLGRVPYLSQILAKDVKEFTTEEELR